MTRKCALKCHRCQRIGHRVKDCNISKRRKGNSGSTKVLGTMVPKPEQIRQITSVWDEFPDFEKPARASHVTSVWDEEPEKTTVKNRNEDQWRETGSETEEEWFDAEDGETGESETVGWEDFPETAGVFEDKEE